jgi:hypothetical protein
MMRRPGRRGQRGQSLAEFTLILPTLLMLVLGTAEMGLALNTSMALVEATREGARVGAALSNGGGIEGCTSGSGTVDQQIIESVQRVVESPGNGIKLAGIDYIHIFKANADSSEGLTNEWTVDTVHGTSICGVKLDFVQGAVNWPASSRDTTLPTDSIGVSIRYHYALVTPLSAIFKVFGGNQITMSDKTIMALEP